MGETIRARAAMLVDAPASEIYRAFTDRARICEFWLDAASADLTQGASVEWTFKVPGARDTVDVRDLVQDRRIRFVWSGGQEVSIECEPHGADATKVSVTVRGFSGEDPAADAIDATEGFAIVLCDLKLLLETGRSPGLVRDKAALIAACGKG